MGIELNKTAKYLKDKKLDRITIDIGERSIKVWEKIANELGMKRKAVIEMILDYVENHPDKVELVRTYKRDKFEREMAKAKS